VEGRKAVVPGKKNNLKKNKHSLKNVTELDMIKSVVITNGP
jgi:hypothetical protein